MINAKKEPSIIKITLIVVTSIFLVMLGAYIIVYSSETNIDVRIASSILLTMKIMLSVVLITFLLKIMNQVGEN